MVKLTIVGRVSDGLPVAQGPRYVNEGDDDISSYMRQAEFILEEISRSGSLVPSKMIIPVDHHCFHYMVENGVCFITLCDSSYPRKLAFYYLRDLVREFEKFDKSFIKKITKPYSFVRFDGIIGNIRRQYTDTRTQSNLAKLNANRRQDLDVITQDLSTIVERRLQLDTLARVEKAMAAPQIVSPVWCSPSLEVYFRPQIQIPTYNLCLSSIFEETSAESPMNLNDQALAINAGRNSRIPGIPQKE